MARLAPPPGYITAKEAKEKLGNISSGMLAYYVAEGKIRRYVPKGRHNGFYKLSEVEDLWASLHTLEPMEKPQDKDSSDGS